RSYMLDDTEAPAEGPRIVATEIGDLYPMSNGLSRLAVRFKDDPAALEGARAAFGRPLDAKAADALGLVTVIPDELDWDDEIRQAVEERASLSPDALTGMEASLRFAGPETPETKVY